MIKILKFKEAHFKEGIVMEKREIRNIIKKIIETQEKLGDEVGGSQHRANTTYSLQEISEPKPLFYEGKDAFTISYVYKILVETEFTYYPDNPPYEYKYEQNAVISDEGEVLKVHQKKGTSKEAPFENL